MRLLPGIFIQAVTHGRFLLLGRRTLLQQFDPGRIFYVLANTVRQKDHDGRISRDNKAWAQTVPVFKCLPEMVGDHIIRAPVTPGQVRILALG